jgi:hypothetical protein
MSFLTRFLQLRPESRGTGAEKRSRKAKQTRKRRKTRARLRTLDLEKRVEKLERQLGEVRAVLSERGPAQWDSGVDRPAWEAAEAHELGW